MTAGTLGAHPENPPKRAGGLASVRRMLTLCVLLYAVPGAEHQLVTYEDRVLALLPAHGGRVVQRVRAVEATGAPYEVHVLEFPDTDALDAYMSDPVRVALADQRDAAIARTEVLRVNAI